MSRLAAGRARGFTLLEVLVAFSIMALALGVLYQASGSNVRHMGEIDQYQRATLLAESVLATVEAVPPAPLQQAGQSERFAWSLQTAPFNTAIAQSAPNAPRLHAVTVRVQWGQGAGQRVVELNTLRPERRAERSGGAL